MDDAVVGRNVGSHDLGAVDGHAAHRRIDHDHLALDRLRIGLLAGEGRTHDFSGHHVIGQDLDQLGLVLRLQEVFDRSGGKLLEGLVGRRKDRERTGAFQDDDEIARLQGGSQRVELTGLHRRIDDVRRIGVDGSERDQRAGGKADKSLT